MPFSDGTNLPTAVLDMLPNPVLVKDGARRYFWVNHAFEVMFDVDRADLFGKLGSEAFPNRQAMSCDAGDKRVLATGAVDESHETVRGDDRDIRQILIRKSRLRTASGEVYLVGVLHDITAVTEANRQLADSKRQLEETTEKLREMAYTDALTGIPNRRRLVATAPEAFANAGRLAGMFICDLDHFKRVNDEHGHDAGDAALRHFVDVARKALRRDDMIARMGGEEFAVFLPGADRDQSLKVAERVRRTLAETPFRHEGVEIALSVSIGAVHMEGGRLSLARSLRQADDCLYEAKENGRNQVVMAS